MTQCITHGIIKTVGGHMKKLISSLFILIAVMVLNACGRLSDAEYPYHLRRPVKVISPCSVTLQQNNPQVVAEYDNGKNILVYSYELFNKNKTYQEITAGVNSTTDGNGCVFTLNADGTIPGGTIY